MNHPKPKVLLSKCLEIEACRFNGQIISSKIVKALLPHIEIIAVCPEVAIGLGVPRATINIYENDETKELELIQPSTKKNLTKDMENFAKKFVSNLENIDGAILKAKSPSCGFKDAKVRASIEKGAHPLRRGIGMFTKEVLNKFSHLSIEDEMRLTNDLIREKFLIKLFLLSKFRNLEPINFKKLEVFHRSNKYLFTLFSKQNSQRLGLILSHNKKIDFEEIVSEYYNELVVLLSKNITYKKAVDSINHLYSHLKKKVSQHEKEFLLEKIKEFENKKIDYNTILSLIEMNAIRFQDKYLLEQTIFEPYPKELKKII